MSVYYPPASFYFSLSIAGIKGQMEASFKEVSGIAMEINKEEVLEGGVNSFQHRVPTSKKISNLVLKRGLIIKDSPIAKWCTATLEGGLNNAIMPKNIVLSLLNENGAPLKIWHFANAWPVKWEIENFNLMSDELIVETIEFAYSYVK